MFLLSALQVNSSPADSSLLRYSLTSLYLFQILSDQTGIMLSQMVQIASDCFVTTRDAYINKNSSKFKRTIETLSFYPEWRLLNFFWSLHLQCSSKTIISKRNETTSGISSLEIKLTSFNTFDKHPIEHNGFIHMMCSRIVQYN